MICTNANNKMINLLSAVMIAVFMFCLTATTEFAEAANKKTQAEIDFEEYNSSHSLKELNSTVEGQKVVYNLFREKYGVNYDSNKNARLENMMTQLSNAIEKIDPTINDLPYVYFVNNEKTFNAFCSFSHVMSVNSGAFDLVANDDELAAIVGHEMGHGQKSHTYKRYKKTHQKVLWANIAGAVLGGNILTDLAGSILLTHSVVHDSKSYEKEADTLAFEYIVHTNYNPGACAAIWQRVIEKFESTGKQSKLELFFNPSDHPNHLARRDKYAKLLYEYSGNHVEVKDGTLIVNKKDFLTPAATSSMSSLERSYFVLGNLAAAYHNGHNRSAARVVDGTVYLGSQPIITLEAGDESAQTLVDRLNSIK